jgi:catechol 2,3-dioxygenase-like lactoylglutathione lyase family enzyme
MNSNTNDVGAAVSDRASASVSVVVLGVENLDASLAFYADTIGLNVAETWTWEGPEFEHYWQLPAGSKARCAFI